MTGILAAMASSVASPVTITNKSCIKTVADPADATATYTVGNDRLIRNQNGVSLEQWLGDTYDPANFEVRAHVNSGDTPSGNLDTWNNLATTRSWSLAETIVGTKTCQLRIEIGYAGANIALDTATITITAVVA